MTEAAQNIIEIRGRVHARDDRNVIFSTDGDPESAVILPLAHVEIGELHRGVGLVAIPAWLAEREGLV